MPFERSRRTLFAAAILSALALPGADVRASGRATPRAALETILKAAAEGDAYKIAASLSESDVRSLKYYRNGRDYADAEKERKSWEKEYGIALGKDPADYFLSRPLLQFTLKFRKPEYAEEKELFSRYVILSERVWDGKYAEVRFFIPYDGKGPVPPLIFPFIKEKGGWKLAQWLAVDMIMAGYGAQGGLDKYVSTRLKTRLLMSLDRSDCSRMKERSWTVPKATDDYFADKVEKASGYKREKLLQYWFFTGSPRAKRLAAGEPALARIVKEYELYAPALGAACRGEKLPAGELDGLAPGEWFALSERDIVGLKNLIKVFPGEAEWKAKAELRVGGLYENMRDFSGAEAKYLTVVKNYTGTAAAPEAKARLASLYWNTLNRQGDAMNLWKELDAIGKLPPGTPLTTARGLVPEQVFEEKAGSGLVDFMPEAGGKLLLLSERVIEDKGRFGVIELFDPATKALKILASLPGNYFKGILASRRDFLVFDSMRAVVCGKDWTPEKMLLPLKGGRIAVLPDDNRRRSSGEDSLLAMDMDENSYTAWTWGALSRFDRAGRRVYSIPPPCGREDYMAIAHNDYGLTMYATGGADCAGFISDSGETKPLRLPLSNNGRFSKAQHLALDSSDNIYVHAHEFGPEVRENKIIKFSPSGRLLGEHKIGDMEYYVGALGGAGDGKVLVYMSARGKPDLIRVIGPDLKTEREIDVTPLKLPRNPAVNGIAGDGKHIYLAASDKLLVLDAAGAKREEFQLGPGLARFTAARDGALYFSNDGKMFRLDGKKAKHVWELPRNSWFEFLPDGTGILYVFRDGLFSFDPRTQKRTPLSFRSQVDFGTGIAGFAADSKGRIVATVHAYLDNNVYLLDPASLKVSSLPNRGRLLRTSRINSLSADGRGSIYLSDYYNQSVVRLDKTGKLSGVLDFKPFSSLYPRKLRSDASGNLYFLSSVGGKSTKIFKLEGNDIEWRAD